MSKLVRIAVLILIAWLLIAGVVVGLAMDTGPIEKVVLLAIGALLVLAAVRVNRIGASPATR